MEDVKESAYVSSLGESEPDGTTRMFLRPLCKIVRFPVDNPKRFPRGQCRAREWGMFRI